MKLYLRSTKCHPCVPRFEFWHLFGPTIYFIARETLASLQQRPCPPLLATILFLFPNKLRYINTHTLSLSLSFSLSLSSCKYLFQFRIIYFVHFLMLFYIIVVQLRYDPSEELFGLDVAPKPRFKMLS